MAVDPEKVGLAMDSEMRQRKPTSKLPLDNDSYADLDEIVESEKPWVNSLVVLSALDIVVSGIMATLAFKVAVRDNGVTLLCIGLEGLAHIMSSVLIMRRFRKESTFGQRDSMTSTLVGRRRDMYTEQKYGIMIGIVLLISCVALVVKAARKFHFWDQWAADHHDVDEVIAAMTEAVAWSAGAWYLLQFVGRYVAQRKLDINLLNHAWPVSAVGFLFCLCMALAATYEKEGTWKADAICACVLALLTGCEGLRTVYHYFDDVEDTLTREKRP